MQEQIEQQIQAWQAALNQLQLQRQQLAAQLADVDTSIQRHIGAIEGARYLQGLPAAPAAPEDPAE